MKDNAWLMLANRAAYPRTVPHFGEAEHERLLLLCDEQRSPGQNPAERWRGHRAKRGAHASKTSLRWPLVILHSAGGGCLRFEITRANLFLHRMANAVSAKGRHYFGIKAALDLWCTGHAEKNQVAESYVFIIFDLV